MMGWLGRGCMYVKGAERRPTRKAREKFSVAREDRKRPRRRREKVLIRV